MSKYHNMTDKSWHTLVLTKICPVWFLVMSVILGVFLAFALYTLTAKPQVLHGNDLFSKNLYAALATEGDRNILFSPIGVHAVLSLAYEGAQGTTAEAFSKILYMSKAALSEGYSEAMNHLNNIQNITLLIANKVFVKTGKDLLRGFQAAAKDFRSEVELLSFEQSAAAAGAINAWVEKKMHNKINDVIQEADLNGETQLVLVSAIYLKGDWAVKFDKAATKKASFYLNDVDSTEVDMMYVESSFNYKHDTNLDAQVLELPYTNKDLSMVVILPNKRNGIKELEKKLQGVDFTRITHDMSMADVIVKLPKFKIETKIDFGSALKTLGLGIIFDQHEANFRGVRGGIFTIKHGKNLYVNKVVQKAFIEVNEEGAEAAAVTASEGVMVRSMMDLPPVKPVITADHPFIFAIKSKSAFPAISTPLFVGRVTNLKH